MHDNKEAFPYGEKPVLKTGKNNFFFLITKLFLPFIFLEAERRTFPLYKNFLMERSQRTF